MAGSLKGYTPRLAQLLETTPAALYERQRALVRAGLLDLGEGRGPGSGVRATAPSIALLLISVLATDNLSEVEARTRQIAGATPIRGQRCQLTQMTTFTDALAAILVSKAMSRQITELRLSRSHQRAVIKFKDGATSEFSADHPETRAVRIEAAIGREIILSVADDVRAIIADS